MNSQQKLTIKMIHSHLGSHTHFPHSHVPWPEHSSEITGEFGGLQVLVSVLHPQVSPVKPDSQTHFPQLQTPRPLHILESCLWWEQNLGSGQFWGKLGGQATFVGILGVRSVFWEIWESGQFCGKFGSQVTFMGYLGVRSLLWEIWGSGDFCGKFWGQVTFVGNLGVRSLLWEIWGSCQCYGEFLVT